MCYKPGVIVPSSLTRALPSPSVLQWCNPGSNPSSTTDLALEPDLGLEPAFFNDRLGVVPAFQGVAIHRTKCFKYFDQHLSPYVPKYQL